MLRLATLCAALALAACSQPKPSTVNTTSDTAPDRAQAPTEVSADAKLFTFESADAGEWEIVNDGVMGGKSKGYTSVEDGVLKFTGTLVTQGGGFTSVRIDEDLDLSGREGLELRVRGGGRTYEVNVDDGTRMGWRQVSRRAPFTTTGEWRTVRVAFDDLQTSVHGRPVEVPAVDLSAVERLGIFIVDGRDGPFELEVDWIGVY